MGSSKGGSSIITGYWYGLTVQLGVCHGPVDAVTEIKVGDRQAWRGSITDNTTITIDREDLFGGKAREGGVKGQVAIAMGADTQQPNWYMTRFRGADMPAYLGILTICFQRFLWSANNPYFKAPAIRVRRIKKGWRNDACWQEGLAQIASSYNANAARMNPVHIIYECLTNTAWGMGYDPSDIDETSFLAAAQTLADEGFGMAIPWMNQSSIEEFVQVVIDHIGASCRLDLGTGQFALKLVREVPEADFGDLIELNPDNCKLQSFQRAAWGETANEVSITFKDDDDNDVSINVQDPANIDYQGAVVSVSKSFPGIRDPDIAQRVALRELHAASSPLAKITLSNVHRIARDLNKGDAFMFVWPKLGITGVVFRVVGISKGRLERSGITIEAIEDVFGLPEDGYVLDPTYNDTTQNPKPVDVCRLMEVPYWTLVKTMSAADLDYLTPGYGFVGVMPVNPAEGSIDYRMNASSTLVGGYTDVGRGDFCQTALLSDDMAIGATTVSFSLDFEVFLDNVDAGEFFYIDDEAFELLTLVETVDEGTDTISYTGTAKRGVLDTLPAAHTAGTRVYFPEAGSGADKTERLDGETVYYKLLTRTASSLLSSSGSAGPLEKGAGNTGTGTVGSIVAGVAVISETWTLTAINSTTFSVVGSVTGPKANATVGAAYSNTFVGFTISAGVTAFVAGDLFFIPTVSAAPAVSITLDQRAERPYPPGKVQINTTYYPTYITDDLVTTWAHRDRIAQTVDLVDFTESSIGPEDGVEYTLEVWGENLSGGYTLVDTQTGLTTDNFTLTQATEISNSAVALAGRPSNPNNTYLKIVLKSTRDGLDSWQSYEWAFDRAGLGYHLGEYLGAGDT